LPDRYNQRGPVLLSGEDALAERAAINPLDLSVRHIADNLAVAGAVADGERPSLRPEPTKPPEWGPRSPRLLKGQLSFAFGTVLPNMATPN
jgi:hypothetical protein